MLLMSHLSPISSNWSLVMGQDLVFSVKATKNAALCVSFNLRHLQISETSMETIPLSALSIKVIQLGLENGSKSANNCCNK
jgi:ABC-type molybdate transport system permease subunit